MYDYKKRMGLKEELRKTAHKIVMLKDNRKMKQNRKFPDWERPAGVWLDQEQYQFRHHHIAASMMRRKKLEDIETLPKGYVWKDGKAIAMENGKRIPYPLFGKIYYMPDMNTISNIIYEYVLEDYKAKYRLDSNLGKVVFDEDVCIGSENPFQKPASGASRARFG